MNNPYYQYAHTLMNTDTMELTKEIADQSLLCDFATMQIVLSTRPDKKDSVFIQNLL